MNNILRSGNIFLLKYLHISKKSSTFVSYLVNDAYVRPFVWHIIAVLTLSIYLLIPAVERETAKKVKNRKK